MKDQKINQRALRAFMKARYPGCRFVGGMWRLPQWSPLRPWAVMTRNEVHFDAVKEILFFQNGLVISQPWMDLVPWARERQEAAR